MTWASRPSQEEGIRRYVLFSEKEVAPATDLEQRSEGKVDGIGVVPAPPLRVCARGSRLSFAKFPRSQGVQHEQEYKRAKAHQNSCVTNECPLLLLQRSND